ncbi:hypothetical protein CR513_50239, partial [Mucuna pruriens]
MSTLISPGQEIRRSKRPTLVKLSFLFALYPCEIHRNNKGYAACYPEGNYQMIGKWRDMLFPCVTNSLPSFSISRPRLIHSQFLSILTPPAMHLQMPTSGTLQVNLFQSKDEAQKNINDHSSIDRRRHDLCRVKDREKTTFITTWGTFCYKVMPSRLKNVEDISKGYGGSFPRQDA